MEKGSTGDWSLCTPLGTSREWSVCHIIDKGKGRYELYGITLGENWFLTEELSSDCIN